MARSTYRSSSNVVYSAKYHLVWCPKYRRRVLVGEVETRLVEIVHQVCAGYRAEVLGIETMPDHVHLLVEVDPSFGVSRLVRLMKGRSSRVLRQEFPQLRRLPSLWTNSWFCSTVGGAPIDVVRRYVENEKLAA
jgi:putative transposase